MKKIKCVCCGLFFLPKANNRQKQKYCNSIACQQSRNRAKNRIWREKKKQDLSFKLSEAERQQKIRDRRKELALQSASSLSKLSSGSSPPLKVSTFTDEFLHQDAFLGLTALITGSETAEEIRAYFVRLSENGKRLRGELKCGVFENST